MRRFLLTVATAATALTAAACGDVTGVNSSIAGTYELRSIDGDPLPVTLGSTTYETGVLEIESNGSSSSGSFVHTLQYRVPGDPFIRTEERFGIWERNGSELEFVYDDNGDSYFADRTSTNTIVVEDEFGSQWLYRRF